MTDYCHRVTLLDRFNTSKKNPWHTGKIYRWTSFHVIIIHFCNCLITLFHQGLNNLWTCVPLSLTIDINLSMTKRNSYIHFYVFATCSVTTRCYWILCAGCFPSYNTKPTLIHPPDLQENFMPLNALQQPGGEEQSHYLDSQDHNYHRAYQALVLLHPAGDRPQASAQEDHALGRELIQRLSSNATLRVPHGSILQRVHAAGGRDATGQHSRSWAVVISRRRK